MIFHTTFKPGAYLEQDLYDFSYNIQARRLLGAGFVRFFIQHSSQVPTRSRICTVFRTSSKPAAYSEQDLYDFSYNIQASRQLGTGFV